jgi:transposase
MNPTCTYVGLDIAKLSLELSPHQAFRSSAFPNKPAGHRRLLSQLRRIPGVVHVICEATGGYEHDLLKALHDAVIPVTRLNPRQVRDFARAKGLLAKTDRIDAALLAEFGRTFTPAPTPPESPVQERLARLVARRQELIGLINQEENRAEHHHDPLVVKLATKLVRTLRSHVEAIETELAVLQSQDPQFDSKVRRLSSVQGVGQLTAWLLLAAIPELGSLRRGQAASLAGVAPFNHDSGPFRGHRHIAHGRSLARSALYMAALVAARHNPVLSPLYKRLRTTGKPAKVALVALMRKLVELANCLLKHPGRQIVLHSSVPPQLAG